MKKKVMLLMALVLFAIPLNGCEGGDGSDKKIAELNSKIEELEQENANLRDAAEKTAETGGETVSVTKGEPVTLSGIVYVGVDIPAGAYDIKSDDDYAGIGVYESESDWNEENMLAFKSLSADPEIVLESYILKDGYVLDVLTNTEFTKVN